MYINNIYSEGTVAQFRHLGPSYCTKTKNGKVFVKFLNIFF